MGQTELTSPYETFELFSRTPLPPDLAKTRRFQREPETTKFVRQPGDLIDDTVPFSMFDGAELAMLAAVPAATPAAGTRQVEARRPEDDSIEIVIVDSGEIERVAPLELDAPAEAGQIEAELHASVSVELSGSSLEPLESSFFLPVAVAQPSAIATPRLPTEIVHRSSWKLPLVIALFLAAAFACGIAAAFALT